jgi:hypothetical protein
MMHDQINKIIMQEIGLGVDAHQRVIDQDTRETLKFNEKNMKYSSQNSVILTKNDIPFDPIETRNLMSSLFNHFTQKIEQEDGTYVSTYYDINGDKGTALEAVVNGEKITSDYYGNDSLRYLDIIMRLNGSNSINLKQYDTEEKKPTTHKRRSRV